MNRQLAQSVRDRAGDRCEYCHLPVGLYDTPFHVDHITAQQHGGQTVAENLALACFHCNLHKGPNIAGVDPATGQMSALFHPRAQVWNEHFAWNGAILMGRTAVGRATVQTLALNAPEFVAVRLALIDEGVYPKE
jgi:HNH endonuclease